MRSFYLGLLLVAIAYAMVSTSLSPLDLALGIPEMIEITGRLFPPSLADLELSDLLQPMLVTVGSSTPCGCSSSTSPAPSSS